MGRPRIRPEKLLERAAFAARLRTLQTRLFGWHGGVDMARSIGVPHRTWLSYLSSVSPPADTILRLILRYHVSPQWLLTGDGPIFWPGFRAAMFETSRLEDRRVTHDPEPRLEVPGSNDGTPRPGPSSGLRATPPATAARTSPARRDSG